ncbi:MAG TPA: hypothetical protein DCM08_14005 [Microscillaceae bacterium]|nr:hypothetical protein [Microscillaceae bacterium]
MPSRKRKVIVNYFFGDYFVPFKTTPSEIMLRQVIKYWLFFSCYWVAGPLQAQFNFPYYQAIQTEIDLPQSPYFYPLLWEKFRLQAPRVLEPPTFFYLYYGYTLQPSYRPQERPMALLRLRAKLSEWQNPAFDWPAFEAMTAETAQAEPLALEVIYAQALVEQKKYPHKTDGWALGLFNAAMQTITQSGDGSRQNPYSLIFVEDAYFFLTLNNLTPIEGYDKREGNLHEIEVAPVAEMPNPTHTQRLFFDEEAVLNYYLSQKDK